MDKVKWLSPVCFVSLPCKGSKSILQAQQSEGEIESVCVFHLVWRISQGVTSVTSMVSWRTLPLDPHGLWSLEGFGKGSRS